jgi:hypothetical protein
MPNGNREKKKYEGEKHDRTRHQYWGWNLFDPPLLLLVLCISGSWWIPLARDLSVLNSTVSVVTMTKKKGKVSFYPLTIDTGYDDTNERNWYIKNWMKKVLKMI